MKRIRFENDAKDFFSIYGSFGEVCGDVVVDNNTVTAENDLYTAFLEYENDENGVLTQNGFFRNNSENDIAINGLKSKFVFEGGDWEVYTQYGSWQNESHGMWQTLNTTISSGVHGARSSYGASPFIALWNTQTQRGYAFHLFPHTAWEMSVSKNAYDGEAGYVSVELGVHPYGLAQKLAAGEKMPLPEVICYTVQNKLDLDCHKLHKYINNRFPRREMPIIYNSWLYKFDRIDSENILSQIEKASELGAEYFVIDAGWFGNGKTWYEYRGDWHENMTYGFCGNMKKISDKVREKGMKFGCWLEIESAGENSEIIKNHPEYFIVYGGKYFLNFADADAQNHIVETVIGLIEKYNLEFIKFDFNQDLAFDRDGVALARYHDGNRDVLARIKAAHPEVYLECCAGGGLRMDLSDADLYDSYWLSDDHSPYEIMRIFRDTVLRMPPQFLEKWAAVRSLEKFEPIYNGSCDKILSAHENEWGFAIELKPSFLKGMMFGGPFGISADLNLLSDDAFKLIAENVKAIKAERSYWQNAVCRIIADSESVTAFEYYDDNMKKIKLFVFALKKQQHRITLYPFVDRNATYRIGNETVAGKELFEDGFDINLAGNYECTVCELEALS